MQRKGLGTTPRAGFGGEPKPKSNLVHINLTIWHLVATILTIFMRINQTLSSWTAHSASWTAQNWLYCTVRICHAGATEASGAGTNLKHDPICDDTRTTCRPGICKRGEGPSHFLLSLSPLTLPLEVGPLKPARRSGEHCKLPQWGPGRRPGWKRIRCTVELLHAHRLFISKVGRAPAALNFAYDTGWDTDWLPLKRSWSPKWRMSSENGNK